MLLSWSTQTKSLRYDRADVVEMGRGGMEENRKDKGER